MKTLSTLLQQADAQAGSEDNAPPSFVVPGYHLHPCIGRGGSGAVYRATRSADGQAVAIKVLNFTSAGTGDRAFHDECNILKAFEHPGIARHLGHGRTSDGRPYLAMEYVDGCALTTYCDRNRLSIEARVRLVVDICRALEYAHGRFVVHRDLKPDNILVDPSGRPRLVDFGIAKFLDGATTQPGDETALALTPEYASPEQLRGARSTIACDIYGLGVVLYELLCGRRPHRRGLRSFTEFRDEVLYAPCPPLAVAAQDTQHWESLHTLAGHRGLRTARLPRVLRGDIERVVDQCLRKDPSRRYPSARALADDLERVLAGRPVQARPESRWYSAARFARRHRLAVSSAAALFVLSTGAAIVLGVLAHRLDQEKAEVQRLANAEQRLRRRAEATAQHLRHEQATTAEVQRLLIAALTDADPNRVARARVEGTWLLEGILTRFEALQRLSPAAAGQALHAAGIAALRQGRYSLATRAGHRAHTAWAQVDTPHGRIEQARALRLVGQAQRQAGDTTAALEPLRRSADQFADLLGEDAIESVRARVSLAQALQSAGRNAEALTVARQASPALGADEWASAATAVEATALCELHRCEEAVPLFEALLARTKVPALSRAALETKLASALSRLGRHDPALAIRREALARTQAVVGDEHLATADRRLALSRSYRVFGRFDAARTEAREAGRIARAVTGEGHPMRTRAEAELQAIAARDRWLGPRHALPPIGGPA